MHYFVTFICAEKIAEILKVYAKREVESNSRNNCNSNDLGGTTIGPPLNVNSFSEFSVNSNIFP